MINILLLVAFIIDRIFRVKSLNEYRQAKEAQLDTLKQQLDLERKNNDIEITEMHKKRYESLKLILEEREGSLLTFKSSLEEANKNEQLSDKLTDQLVDEINRLARYKKVLETEKQALVAKVEEKLQFPGYRTHRERFLVSRRP
ncbi:hypothetical protein GCM10023149_37680 [Mucilaginibacter gynuensis]|uniref:Uncharacterized protein n=1 Tax=Mucilaginibacter gynuensis TaxID=1302236 RepID=A0ABP8GZ54_9SPHI